MEEKVPLNTDKEAYPPPYPSPGQQYPPQGQPYPQAGQPYPQAGQPYVHTSQPYAPHSQPYAPQSQPYAPTTQPYPPGHQYVAPSAQQVTVTTAVQRPSSGPVPCTYICSLVVAIFACCCGCWLLAIPAVVLGIMSLVVHPTDAKAARTYCLIGLGLWVAAIVFTIIFVIVIFVVYLPVINQVVEEERNRQDHDWSYFTRRP